MKKILLGFVILLVIIAGIFYQPILDTIEFYQYQQEHTDTFARATITWKPIPFDSRRNFSSPEEQLKFDSLTLQVPFPASISSGDTGAMALGMNKSVSIERSNVAASFFTEHNFDTEARDSICTFLSSTAGRSACDSEYEFYRAFLELNATDIHAFASIKHKQLYNQLLMIRAEVLPSNTISAFETSRTKGFLYTTPSGYIADLFDHADQQYRITFTNIEQAEIMFMLSNLQYSPQ